VTDEPCRRAKLWWQKWRWYERNTLPWNRARIHHHAHKGRFFIRFPIQGNVLEALDDGRLQIGDNTLLEPMCWITISEGARVRIGRGHVPEHRDDDRGDPGDHDRRPRHVRQQLLRRRREPPLRQPRRADHLAGFQSDGPCTSAPTAGSASTAW